MSKKSIKKIAVLTGGGDCPGLNAVIRAVTKTAMFQHGLEVYGVEDGYEGLIENRFKPLTTETVSNILTVGGTILGSNNKCDPKRVAVKNDKGEIEYKDYTYKCLDNLRMREIDALIVIGGDGTMSGASELIKNGVNCIGVPKTIDNDLEGTDVTFGFATARYIATEALDRIHTTAASHHRAMIVEVMGRNAGWLALHSGIASGSDIILIPEIPFDLNKVCAKVEDRSQHGKRFTIICISEGATIKGEKQVISQIDPTSPDPIRLGGIGEVLEQKIKEHSHVETRCTILGHVQRGGSPVAEDRVLATEFGHQAVDILMQGLENRLVVMKGRTVTHSDLLAVANKQRLVPLDHPLIKAARAVGTSFGD